MSERDPRVAMRVGDKLRRKHEVREVLSIRTDSLGLVRGIVNLVSDDRRERQKGTSKRTMNLIMWRKWAATAEVIQRGEDAATGRKE